MRGPAATTLLLVLGLLAGCSVLRGPDEYRSARELPPLTLPAGAETRPIKPRYAIPPGPVPTTWPKKFEVPRPRPLVVAEEGAATATPGAPAAAAERPALTQDGNGYPLMSVSGDFNAIWDRLEEALRRAGVKVEDRDQRVSLYYLRLNDATGRNVPYQLRLARTQSAYTLTLQMDDDTLAPQETSRTLFEALVRYWTEPERQPGTPTP
ncbi:MAG TPA: outer membrane protein assembly factor BamC [Moraxellaceae bacterium]|nr:outer membrane protein assembly factor BamC [Moraxellaceae bacterium]